MKITWLGHACFKVEKEGYTLILDPYADGSVPGLSPMREAANKVLCSHEHGDHSGRETVALKGQAEDPFQIDILDTFHDDCGGTQRGTNRITIIEDGNCKAAHLGDLGCMLTPEETERLKNLDVLMIPVGGHYTIDAQQAAEIVQNTAPRIVIPMHFRDDKKKFGYDVIGTADAFTELMDHVQSVAESEFIVEEQAEACVIVLEPYYAK